MIEEKFKDEIKGLKVYWMTWKNRTIERTRNKPKSKLNMLDDEKNYTLKNLDVDLTTLM